MTHIYRRQFLGQATLSLAAGSGVLLSRSRPGLGAQVQRKMTLCLSCGAIGVTANQREAVDLASRHGFEAVEANAGFLAALADEQLQELREAMKTKSIVFGSAGLPVEFRQDEAKFSEGLKGLPRITAALQHAGVTRVSTWIMPGHDTLTYGRNFKQHAGRLREVAGVLKEHGLRFGLEYVGPKTLWSSKRYPFIHTMKEFKELLTETDKNNIGFLLDSWHWYCAGETAADILSLRKEQIVCVHLNDAPAGMPVDQQIDSKRALPASTGVIDISGFLGAVLQLGYDGPVVIEPCDAELNKLPTDQKLQKVIDSVPVFLHFPIESACFGPLIIDIRKVCGSLFLCQSSRIKPFPAF